MEGLFYLKEVFGEAGLSRGTMNGVPLGFVADFDGGYPACCDQGKFLSDLRAYEKRKGIARTYRESVKATMRSEIAEQRARKRARS
jgi:hypothetical protein